MATVQDVWDAAKRKDFYHFCRGICCDDCDDKPCKSKHLCGKCGKKLSRVAGEKDYYCDNKACTEAYGTGYVGKGCVDYAPCKED